VHHLAKTPWNIRKNQTDEEDRSGKTAGQIAFGRRELGAMGAEFGEETQKRGKRYPTNNAKEDFSANGTPGCHK